MNIQTILLYLVSLLPVLMFVLLLVWLDSFSLLKKRYLCFAFVWGLVSAIAAFYCNFLVSQVIPVELFVAPIAEETLKGLGVLFLIKSRRSVFFIDSVLYGVAIGAGFAFLENINYIHLIPDMALGTAIMRGVGTAIMHCGAVAGTAAILNWVTMRTSHTLRYYPLALIPAICLHSLYNSLIMPPFLALIVIIIGVTAWIVLLIFHNEKSIGKWLEMEMFSEVELLESMGKGEFTNSRTGKYMMSIREQFTPERFLDMYCYVKIYFELSLLCKRNLMLAEAGIDIPQDHLAERKSAEFHALTKQIGKTGELALAPIVQQDKLMKWKIKSIKK